MAVRILLAEDHRLVREGLRALLEKHPDFEVVGEAENGREALRLSAELRPDVVIMDVGMPELNGIGAARQLTADFPAMRVIGLSMHADRRLVVEMLRAGASGYILKDCAFQELDRAVRTVASGQTYLGPAVAGLVVEEVVRRPAAAEPSPLGTLSDREREVLQLLAEGRSTKEIGERLHVSPKTVETHRKRIMDKLRLFTLPELTKFAVREGLTGVER